MDKIRRSVSAPNKKGRWCKVGHRDVCVFKNYLGRGGGGILYPSSVNINVECLIIFYEMLDFCIIIFIILSC